MEPSDDRSLKGLLGDLTHSVTTLFRKEIELARAEISRNFPGGNRRRLDRRRGNPRARCAHRTLAGPGPRLDRARSGTRLWRR